MFDPQAFAAKIAVSGEANCSCGCCGGPGTAGGGGGGGTVVVIIVK